MIRLIVSCHGVVSNCDANCRGCI